MKAVADHPNRHIREAMHKYEFTLILAESLELTEELADALCAVGCDDGAPSTCHGVFSVDFHREAVSLEDAIRSAIEDVKTAGYEVIRVEIAAEAMEV